MQLHELVGVQQKVTLKGRMIFLYINEEIIPYVRTTFRAKFAEPKAKEYGDWQQSRRQLIEIAMAKEGVAPFPSGVPLIMTVNIYIQEGMWKKDLSNLLKSLEDLTQGAIFPNDSWIQAHIAFKWRAKRGPRAEVDFYCVPPNWGKPFSIVPKNIKDYIRGQPDE